MRWITRHAVFVFCFSVGSTAWYVLAQRQPALAQHPVPATEKIQEGRPNLQADAVPPAAVVPVPSVKYGPVEPMVGYANSPTIILRESAEPNAPVKARLNSGEYTELLVLGATPDSLHVKITVREDGDGDAKGGGKVFEGWTGWGSVVMDLSAVVMDAETGKVVSRVPLTDGLHSVIFSPDGTRALFFHDGDGNGSLAYEARTSDYTLTRRLAPAEDNAYLGTLFYGPAGGDLYAAALARDGSASSQAFDGKVHLLRLGEGGAESVPLDFQLGASNFAVSRDGLLGFNLRRDEGNSEEIAVDVVELSTLKVRNTFTLAGENLPMDSSGFVLNPDGSELYIRLAGNPGIVSVIDTQSGQFLRALHASASLDSYFGPESLLGDSLLLSVWNENEDEMHYTPHMFWAGTGELVAADSGINYVAEAGGKRFAVNDEGTRLLRLDSKNRVRERMTIARPELHKGATGGDGLSVFGLRASPDGKRLIMFLGIRSGC
jgi:DNA-binding beta-propeller fold protein YncE